jgi:hypothetical protein
MSEQEARITGNIQCGDLGITFKAESFDAAPEVIRLALGLLFDNVHPEHHERIIAEAKVALEALS